MLTYYSQGGNDSHLFKYTKEKEREKWSLIVALWHLSFSNFPDKIFWINLEACMVLIVVVLLLLHLFGHWKNYIIKKTCLRENFLH